ncbi:MAG: sterol desaturase family protein [Pseudomonadota bacterium]|nr:sterol desaturase family protein [Pseudomonadota bacterium]
MTTPVPEPRPGTPAEAPRAGAGEWHFAPELPIGNNPLFVWPLRVRDIVTYHRDYWLTLSEAVIFLALAVAGWWGLRSIHGDMSVLAPGWIGAVLALNFGLVLLFAGGFHLFFYSFRKQGDERKYVAQFGHRGGSRFTFGNQVHDNMFWSLTSGVPIWSGYVVLILWTHANGWTPAVTMADNPVLFVLILMFTGPWVAFHFYWGHRLLHTGPLYRHVHSLHHRNVNVGPWSGISMHPVEHVIYFSSILVHLVVPSHPVIVMFHGYMLALSAIFGHTGFHELLVGRSRRMLVGHFHHQLHHRYFECNYGSVDFPLDVWFGTFHDGTAEARRRLKERLGPR